MESKNLSIANWQSHEIEEISYSVSLKVPPKDEILRLLPTHLSNLPHEFQFVTGIISKTEHKLKLCLYREFHEPKLGIFVSITNTEESNRIVEVRGIDITYVSSEPVNLTVEDNMTKIDPPKQMESNGFEFWQSTCGWPDCTTILFLLLHIVKRKPPRIVNDDSDQMVSKLRNISNTIDTEMHFLSSNFSDVTVQSGLEKFPAHLLILCNRSKYFASMFSSSMKETREKLVKIDDMEPSTVKELLRYIYKGEIENPEIHSRELFVAADKYDMPDLKAVCESHLVEKLSVENAIGIYDLGQMHSSQLLFRKAKEIILWNKGKFAPDPETLKEFTCKYPELMFELLNFES